MCVSVYLLPCASACACAWLIYSTVVVQVWAWEAGYCDSTFVWPLNSSRMQLSVDQARTAAALACAWEASDGLAHGQCRRTWHTNLPIPARCKLPGTCLEHAWYLPVPVRAARLHAYCMPTVCQAPKVMPMHMHTPKAMPKATARRPTTIEGRPLIRDRGPSPRSRIVP